MRIGDWILLFVVWEGFWLCAYILADMARYALTPPEPARYIGNKQEDKK